MANSKTLQAIIDLQQVVEALVAKVNDLDEHLHNVAESMDCDLREHNDILRRLDNVSVMLTKMNKAGYLCKDNLCEPPAPGLDADEQAFAAMGDFAGKIEAIKHYRARTRAGLLDAKNAVEAWMVTAQMALPLNDEEQKTVKDGDFGRACIAYRNRTGVGLKQSKDIVETWMQVNGIAKRG